MTGQSRTWSNTVTREPVLGMGAGAAPADAAIGAFLCGLSGYCDYKPGLFAQGKNPELRGRSIWAHQLALGVVFCSPVPQWARCPELTSAAFPEGSLERVIYQSIHSTWDETVVPSASTPGSIAAFASRKGKDWFFGMINSNENESVTLESLDGLQAACPPLRDRSR